MIQDVRKLQLFKSSVPLCRLDDSGHPSRPASGALVRFKGKNILLTVEHVTGDFGDWAIQIQYEPDNGTKLFRLGAMNFLRRGDVSSGKFKTIDFSYLVVPEDIRPLKQEITESFEILGGIPIDVHELKFPCLPDQNESYGFSGFIKASIEQHPHALILSSEAQIYDGLKYIETRDNDVLVFSMPETHPGHAEFEGCSGSPIISSKGEVIGLLTGGSESRNEIYGVSLESYRVVLELHASGEI